MASKKNIINRMNQLEQELKNLKEDIEEHYKEPKDNICFFESKYSDLNIELIENKWGIMQQNRDFITLGVYPNERWKIIERALEYVKNREISKNN